jgi:hypothetical protein
MPRIETILVNVPPQFLKFYHRRDNISVTLTVTISFTNDNDVSITNIAGTEDGHFNIHWNHPELRKFINDMCVEHVKQLFSFENVFSDEQLK